jgi:hypothetical protein
MVIAGLLMTTLPVLPACSLDKPQYSSNAVVDTLQQRLHLAENGSLTQDRYGAMLLGKPLVLNFRLTDWEAKYQGDGKWLVSALVRYKEGFDTQTDICSWYFYETSGTIEYIGNGE